MTRTEFFYTLPYFFSLALSLVVLYYTWRRRNAKGARTFVWYITAQSIWILGFVIELVMPDLYGKVFWDGIQWLAVIAVTIIFPIFVVQFTDYQLSKPRQAFFISLIVPVVFTLALMTDGYHHLVYPNPHLTVEVPFSELLYDFTWVVIGFALYSYLIMFLGLGLLISRIFRLHGLYRAQTAIITIGVSIPILGTILSLFNIPIGPQRDIAPLTNAIANIIISWGLLRYRIFDIAPVGRDRLFEAIVDPVVILDNQHLVVDINSSMLVLLDRNASDVVGQPAKQVFANFPIPIKLYTHVSYARAETTFDVRGQPVYYEMTVWPIYDRNKNMTGRIYIAHDITALKELERELRDLNTDLEQRVRERTRQLAEAYDTTLEGWAKALELRDKETEGHSRRVTETTVAVARAMGISEDGLEHIRRGAILHDIGKMGVPDEILRKAGPLTGEEREIILKHPGTAYELLKQIPFLEKALDIPYCHHEKWDGSGYPRGLRGEGIPLAARIFAVVDVWDALTSTRPYRQAWGHERTAEYIKSESGKHFDPQVVEKFLELFKED